MTSFYLYKGIFTSRLDDFNVLYPTDASWKCFALGSFPPSTGISTLSTTPTNLTISNCNVTNCKAVGCTDNFQRCTTCKVTHARVTSSIWDNCTLLSLPVPLNYGKDLLSTETLYRQCSSFALKCVFCPDDYKTCQGCDTNFARDMTVVDDGTVSTVCRSVSVTNVDLVGLDTAVTNGYQLLKTCSPTSCKNCFTDFMKCENC